MFAFPLCSPKIGEGGVVLPQSRPERSQKPSIGGQASRHEKEASPGARESGWEIRQAPSSQRLINKETATIGRRHILFWILVCPGSVRRRDQRIGVVLVCAFVYHFSYPHSLSPSATLTLAFLRPHLPHSINPRSSHSIRSILLLTCFWWIIHIQQVAPLPRRPYLLQRGLA